MKNNKIDFKELEKFNEIPNVYPIILITNPYNNLCSAWKVYNQNQDFAKAMKNLWIEYATLYLQDNDLIKVSYDRFYADEPYRISVLQAMSISYHTVKQETENHTKWGHSSFQDPSQQRGLNATLTNNPFCKDPNS